MDKLMALALVCTMAAAGPVSTRPHSVHAKRPFTIKPGPNNPQIVTKAIAPPTPTRLWMDAKRNGRDALYPKKSTTVPL
jgi:hypothetical protein